MKNWIEKLDAFLSINERDILTHAGKISHEIAIQHAEKQYEEFSEKRIKAQDRLESDFDRSVKMVEQKVKSFPKQKD